MIDANAIDAVGFRRQACFGRAVDGRAVDQIVDLVRRDAHFEGVGGLAARIGFLHCVVRCFRRHVFRVVAVPAFDQPGAVLRHQEIEVALLRAFEIASTEDDPVVVRMTARFHQNEGPLERVGPGCRVRRVPEDRGLGVRRVKPRSARDELDRAGGVGI